MRTWVIKIFMQRCKKIGKQCKNILNEVSQYTCPSASWRTSIHGFRPKT